jgi:RNA polymerase-binding transcription factor DksA
MSAARKPTRRGSSASSSSAKKPAAKRKTPKKTTARKSAAAKKTPKKTAARKKASASGSQRGAVKKPTGKRTRATSSRRSARTPRAATKKPAAPARATRARPAKLDKKTLARIRAELVAERGNYEAQMAALEEESFQGTQSELTGDVAIDEDFADAGSATFDREQALSIQNNIRDLIDQVNRALGRIEEGTYGSCERCGRPIDPARLQALPRTLLCQDCKRREERAR